MRPISSGGSSQHLAVPDRDAEIWPLCGRYLCFYKVASLRSMY